MGEATKLQKTKIHTLAGLIGMDDDARRDAMENSFGVRSTTEMTEKQAKLFIEHLEMLARKRGVEIGKKRKYPGARYSELGHRPDMASPAQLRMLEAKWSEVSYMETHQERDLALCSWLFKRFNVSHPTMIRGAQVGKIVKALDAMIEQKAQREAKV